MSSGFREYFNSHAFCVVEWPEKAGVLLAAPDLEVQLQFSGEGRSAHLESHSPAGESWLASLRWPA